MKWQKKNTKITTQEKNKKNRFFNLLKYIITLSLHSQKYHGDCSSVGRASDCGSEGRGFKPHHSPKWLSYLFRRRAFFVFYKYHSLNIKNNILPLV